MTVIYNPKNTHLLKQRVKEAAELLERIPAKHCFITGSYLYSKKYADLDIFIISRTKKKPVFKEKNIRVQTIDFNDLHSLFYHSASKSCIAKNILPEKDLKVTVADYWQVINEAVPSLLNSRNKAKFKKATRALVLYTEYLLSGIVLDSFQLSQKIQLFKEFNSVLEYIVSEAPKAVLKNIRKSYAKRFFYTQAAYYKQSLEYDSQRILYDITHRITRGISDGST